MGNCKMQEQRRAGWKGWTGSGEMGGHGGGGISDPRTFLVTIKSHHNCTLK